MIGNGWVGVDLDGTLAEYHGWVSETHIGAPIPEMVNRVRFWLAVGVNVRIFTARMFDDGGKRDVSVVRRAIEDWCESYLGRVLIVTNVKDYDMIELWDDRAVSVEENTGRPLAPSRRGL